jgi:hypothetical protein
MERLLYSQLLLAIPLVHHQEFFHELTGSRLVWRS